MTDSRASHRILILLTLCVSLFMAMLDNTVVNTALPHIQRGLGTNITGLQWIVDGYSLSFASLMLTASTFGDMYGRKRMFLGGLVLFTSGSAICALAGSLPMLVTGRVVEGTGAACLIPGTLSILRNTFVGERERGIAIGVWAGVSGLGLGLGPVIGGPLVDHFNWPSVFWINVPVGILGLLAAIVVLPESADRRGRRMDVPGQLLGIAGIGGVVYATIEGPLIGWTSPALIAIYAGAALALLAFGIVEHRTPTPMLKLAVFRDRVFSGALLGGFAVYFGMFAVLYFLSLWLQEVLGWSATHAGLAIVPALVVAAAVAPVAGWLSGRSGGAVPLTVGLTLAALSLFLFTRYGAHATYGQFWYLLPIVGAGMGLTLTPITTTALSRMPAQQAGLASGLTNTVRELGGVLGVAVLGSILTQQMISDLGQRLGRLGIPAGQRAAIVGTVKAGGGLPRSSGPRSASVTAAVNLAYVHGLHVAEYCGCGVLTVAAVLAWVLLRRPAQARSAAQIAYPRTLPDDLGGEASRPDEAAAQKAPNIATGEAMPGPASR
jgi:EmrB/QacA subfamily drug resistance transporter